MSSLTDAEWTELTAGDTAEARVFTRLLGPTEVGFYWDSEFNGTSDVTHHHTIAFTSDTLRIEDASADEARFRAVWIALKQRFPLLAARVEECNGGDRLAFVVDEQRTRTIMPGEFEFIAHGDEDQIRAIIERGRNAVPRYLSRERSATITVLRRSGTEYDLVLTITHLICDGISSFFLTRTLCDLLSRWPHSLEMSPPDLRLRLAMAPSCDSLHPQKDVSPVRLRWRRAIATVMSSNRIARLRGGHTIPNKRTPRTPHTPALSRDARLPPFDVETTRKALSACHSQGVTLGHILVVAGQLALSRMMRRRLEHGVISKEEWDQRRITPTLTDGPLNLRPHLEQRWLAAGGHTELLLAINVHFAQLPYMPDAGASGRYTDAFSPNRFWYRARLVKKQADSYARHPLFLEMITAVQPIINARSRSAAEALRAGNVGDNAVVSDSAQATDKGTAVFLHGGSSMGDVDSLCPYLFPIPDPEQGGRPEAHTLERIRSETYLRCMPGMLYLGAMSVKGELQVGVFYDGVVYEKNDAEEWLGEVGEVLKEYLCGRYGSGKAVRARL